MKPLHLLAILRALSGQVASLATYALSCHCRALRILSVGGSAPSHPHLHLGVPHSCIYGYFSLKPKHHLSKDFVFLLANLNENSC